MNGRASDRCRSEGSEVKTQVVKTQLGLDRGDRRTADDEDLSAQAEQRLAVMAEATRATEQILEAHRQLLARAETVLAVFVPVARVLLGVTRFLRRWHSIACAYAVAAIQIVRRPLRGPCQPSRPAACDADQQQDSALASHAAAEERMPLGQIVATTVVEQTITARQNNLYRVSLLLGTYNRPNTCHLCVTLLDEAGHSLGEISQSAAELSDNKFCDFTFTPVPDSQGKVFRVRVTSADASRGNALTLWARRAPRRRGLTLNGRLVADAEVSLKLYYRTPEPAWSAALGKHRDILIITPDRLGKTRIGVGMRHWEIAQALSNAGLQVTLASTRPLADDLPAADFPVGDLSVMREQVDELAQKHAVVMVQGNALTDCPRLSASGRPILVDMVTPFHIENVQTSQYAYDQALSVVNECLNTADFFVCGNERQRLYWLGMLTALGRISKHECQRDSQFRELIDVVGFGVPDAEPVKTRAVLKGVYPGIARDDFLLMWFGGIWDWLDPLPLIEAVHAVHRRQPRIKLFFSMYRKSRDENPTKMAVRARAYAEELGALGKSIFFNELPIPFDQRADYLLESDLGVMVQAPNFETQISARTRALDYLWTNLPIFANQGDEISELVQRHGAGVIIESNAADQIEHALLEYVRDEAGQRRAAEAVGRLKQQLRWSSMVQPILRFCQHAQQRNPRPPVEQIQVFSCRIPAGAARSTLAKAFS